VSSTRERILGAARELIEHNGGTPNMSELARAVGISRQALYLHFPDRAALLLALVAYVDEREDLAAAMAAVQAAPGAASQIRAWAEVQSWRNPRIAPFARALDQARHTDLAASAAWRDRTGNRMRGAVAIITRLREEGRLHPSWKTEEAAALLWELTSFHVWDDLVNESRLTPGRYVEIITATALAALASPIGERAGAGPARRHRNNPAAARRRHTG
jgi:AcrR family transcriptional regulator